MKPLSIAIAVLAMTSSSTSIGVFAQTSDEQHPTICQQVCERCPLVYEIKPYPKRVIPNVYIGWANQDSYSDDGLLGPMLVPIEITSRDTDEIHIKCSGGCQIENKFSDWTIDWEVSGYDPSNPYPFRQGSLVDAQAVRHNRLNDRWAVLYLPPEDLGPNETRTITITAVIRDLGEDGKDKDAKVVFDGTIKRSNEVWSVDLKHQAPEIKDEQQDPCQGSSAPCELVGPQWLPEGPPTKRFSDLPSAMFVDEVRALTFAASDLDRINAECGIPNEFCSTFCHRDIDDEISYSWSITHVNANDTGNGIIEQFGSLAPNSTQIPRSQTIMFSATKKGKLRLEIRADSTRLGDFTIFTHDTEIFERRTKFVDHKPTNQHEIFVDGWDNLSYWTATTVGLPGLEFQDNNDDGDATDPGDFNFPMAYTRNTEPQLNLFVQTASETPSMPGAIIFGSDTTVQPGIQYFSRLDQDLHRLIPTLIVGMDFTSIGLVPNKVGIFNHTVRWEVFYTQVRAPAHHPEHTYRIYTTLNDPQALGATTLDPAHYRLWESAYDISCRGGQDATTATGAATGVFEKIKAHFGTLVVLRKDKDGFNYPDGVHIRYWGNVGEIDPNAPHLDIRTMLLTSGIGTCQSITQLFKLCLAIQGLQSTLTEFSLRIAIRLPGVLPATFMSFPGLLAGDHQRFLVNDYHFNPPAGDTAEVLAYGTQFSTPPGTSGFWPVAPPPGRTATDTDPDRGRMFHYYDMDVPHTAPWAKAIDLLGRPGVGAADPNSLFNNHVLVDFGGFLYDPCYGDLGHYANVDEYGPTAVAGVIVPDLRGAGGPQGATSNLALQLWAGTLDAPQFIQVAYSSGY